MCNPKLIIKNPIKAILFDLDGTLLDSSPDFIEATSQLLTNHNLDKLSCEQIRGSISNGVYGILRTAFNIEANDPKFESLRDELLDLYKKCSCKLTKPFAGILPLLDDIESAGLKWGIATNKPVELAIPIINHLKLDKRCSALVCPEHVKESKPAPDMILLACKQLQIKPHNTIYIGDDQRDITAGKLAGSTTISAAWGYINNNDNAGDWGADAIAANPSHLHQMLKQAKVLT